MNQFIKRLLIASLATLTGAAGAVTNKTHYQPRPAGVNLAMERTTWNTQINKKITKADDKVGASLQVTGFYEASTNGEDMGKYFGFDNMNKLTIGAASSGTKGHIDRRHLIHDYENTQTPKLTSKLNLNFEHRQAGVRFDYFQDLDQYVKGLYFHINAPIVWSQTRSHLNVCDETAGAITTDPVTDPVTTKGAADYFCCGIEQTGSNLQEPLKYAKICKNKSKTSLADIDLKLGWNFWETIKNHAGINIGITIPTSPKAKGEYLFEPMGGGNGGHFGLGAGLDFKARLWEDKKQSIDVQVIASYRYLFESSDTRTLGLKKSSNGCDNVAKSWGQYLLVGEYGKQGVQPAANILTQKVDVKVGSQFDMLAGFAYNYSNLKFDLGYELFARENERVSNRCCAFPNDTYALAGYNFDANQEFASNYFASLNATSIAQATVGSDANGTLKASDIVTSVAETPSIITHKVYAGFGYICNKWKKAPIMLSLGGEYEFADQAKALKQWGIFGKLGVTF